MSRQLNDPIDILLPSSVPYRVSSKTNVHGGFGCDHADQNVIGLVSLLLPLCRLFWDGNPQAPSHLRSTISELSRS